MYVPICIYLIHQSNVAIMLNRSCRVLSCIKIWQHIIISIWSRYVFLIWEVFNQTQNHLTTKTRTVTSSENLAETNCCFTTQLFPLAFRSVYTNSLAQTVQSYRTGSVSPHWLPAGTFLQIRIVGGRSSYEGRVEVQVGSKWGTVCSTGWTTREAMVVCRQLGLGYSMHAITVSIGPKS